MNTNILEKIRKFRKLILAVGRWIIAGSLEVCIRLSTIKRMKYFLICDLSQVLVLFASVADVIFSVETKNSEALI